jgi:glycerol kinase
MAGSSDASKTNIPNINKSKLDPVKLNGIIAILHEMQHTIKSMKADIDEIKSQFTFATTEQNAILSKVTDEMSTIEGNKCCNHCQPKARRH